MRTLFIVEPTFLTKHVGVRRVILHYAQQLQRDGYTVEYAAMREGALMLLTPTVGSDQLPRSVAWSDREARPSQYQSTVVTTPWITEQLPALPRCVGIVYDLVPNLVAAGCLPFSNSAGVFRFAHEHDVGFRYYLRHARRIVCISESTRSDFVECYGSIPTKAEIVARTPFSADEIDAPAARGHRVLLVNALDPRKNLARIADILVRARREMPLTVDVVGRERASRPAVADFFYRLSVADIQFTWYRDADDRQLTRLYQDTAVLLFPSLYEGCGLPVLEAQQAGAPVITSNVSSLPELAMNPSLCFPPDDVEAMARALCGLLARTREVLTGQELRSAVCAYLAAQPDPVSLLAA